MSDWNYGQSDRMQTYRRDRLRAKRIQESTFVALPYDLTLSVLFGVGYSVILSYGGQVMVGIMVLGVMIGYLLDLLRVTEAALSVMWLTTFAEIFASFIIFLSHMPFGPSNIFLLFNTTVFQVLAALWATLHVRWVQKEGSGPFLEMLLLSTVSLPAAAVWCWGITSAIGMYAGCFSFSILLAICYRLVVASTKHSKGKRPEDDPKYEGPTASTMMQQRKRRKAVDYIVPADIFWLHTVFVPLFPVFVYVATMKSEVFSLDGVLDMLLLWSIPMIAVMLHIPSKDGADKGGLWWLTSVPSRLRAKAQKLIAFGIIFVDIVAVQTKLVRHSIGAYIYFFHSRPMLAQALLLLSAMVSLVSVQYGQKAIRFRGIEERDTHKSGFQLSLGLLGLIWGVLLGVKWYGVLLSAATGFIAARFLLQRKAWQIVLGACAGVLTFYFIIYRWFGYLDMGLSDVSARFLAPFLTAFAAISALFMGVSLHEDSTPRVISVAWITLIAGLSIGECALTADNDRFATDIYPGYLVLGTSCLGIAVSNRLYLAQQVGAVTRSVGLALMASKCAAVVSPGDFQLLASASVVMLAISAVFFAFNPLKNRASLGTLWALMTGVLLGVLMCRDVWVNMPLKLLFSEIEGVPPLPMQGAWIGIMVLSAYLSALAFHHRFERRKRRIVSLAILFLGILLLSKPGLAVDFDTTSSSSIGRTVVILSIPVADWPSYLSVLALGVVAVVFTSGIFLPRALTSVLIGVPLGISVALTYMPRIFRVSSIFLIAVFTATTMLLTTIHFEGGGGASPSSSIDLGALASMGVLVAAYIFTVNLDLVVNHEEGIKAVLFGVHASMSFLVALMAKARNRREGPSSSKHAEKPYALIGNLCAILCLLGGWGVTALHHDGELSGIAVSPVLLLLNRVPSVYIFHDLRPRNRFVPVVLMGACYLVLRSGAQIVSSLLEISRVFDLVFICKNSVLLALSASSLYQFTSFIWRPRPSSDNMWLYTTAPLNVFPVLMGDMTAVRLLGAGAIAGSLYQIHLSMKLKEAEESRL